MSVIEKIENIIIALILLLCAGIMIYDPEQGRYVVVLISGVVLTCMGIRTIFFYFTMSRYMVDGDMMLPRGVVILDLGLFSFILNSVNSFFLNLFLAVYCVVVGVLSLLDTLQEKKAGGTKWKGRAIAGVIPIVAGLGCLFFAKTNQAFVLLFSAVLIYMAVTKIVNVFKKNKMVYIQ